ncbi:glycosyl transferase family 2 [Dyadobacter jejuensis]|uniref:Glycosyl transferase family 2 n=1 Tax=Dyadobacter jejuensis TaxID=1082580 RepID=A0A316ASY4_9BACT|nr:glycosyltransferase [Dyadobacter jejuensis]PWJ60384.1 glycosyl transferase family 2 [Dyadobacter jejuensis]
MKMSLVSVIYPVYNDSPDDIRLSMGSIIGQDYKDLEIIVIDDSTDKATIAALDEYRTDERVIIIRENGKNGLAQALNNGLKVAQGMFIARADADDIQDLSRISKQISYLKAHPEIGILGSNVNYIDAEGKFVKTRIFPENPDKISQALHLRNPICHSVVMIRKSVLDQIGVYDVDFKRAEDYELWFRADANGVKIANLQEVLLNYKMANAVKRDDLNWKLNLKLKKKYFSRNYLTESLIGIASVYLYLYTPKSVQNFIYNKLA